MGGPFDLPGDLRKASGRSELAASLALALPLERRSEYLDEPTMAFGSKPRLVKGLPDTRRDEPFALCCDR
jgi:hypothetical protein